MFPCGHTFCKKCTGVILTRNGRVQFVHRVSCPMCREVCLSNVVRYVLLESKYEGGPDEEWEEPVANVNHTSKILAVVKTLLRIQRKEPGAKILVFSWVSMFKSSVAHACERCSTCSVC